MQEPSFEVGGLATAHRIHTLLLRSFAHRAKYFFARGENFFSLHDQGPNNLLFPS